MQIYYLKQNFVVQKIIKHLYYYLVILLSYYPIFTFCLVMISNPRMKRASTNPIANMAYADITLEVSMLVGPLAPQLESDTFLGNHLFSI